MWVLLVGIVNNAVVTVQDNVVVSKKVNMDLPFFVSNPILTIFSKRTRTNVYIEHAHGSVSDRVTITVMKHHVQEQLEKEGFCMS